MLAFPRVENAVPTVFPDPTTPIGIDPPPWIAGQAKVSIVGKGEAEGVGAKGICDGVGEIDVTVEKNDRRVNEIAVGSVGDVTHGQLPIPLTTGPDVHVLFT